MLNRRRFIEAMLTSSLSAAGGLITPRASAAEQLLTAPNDFKALVCVFLNGGNDSWNTVVPYSQAEYDAYGRSRGLGESWGVALSRDTLLPLNSDLTSAAMPQYALNPNLPDLQRLYEDAALAIIPSIGPLIKPTTKEQYLSAAATRHPIPPNLFSHNSQQDQWQSLSGQAGTATGWAGRITDLYKQSGIGGGLPSSFAIGQLPLMQTGAETKPFVLGLGGGLDIPLLYWGGRHNERHAAVEAMLAGSTSQGSAYARVYGGAGSKTLEFSATLRDVLSAGPDFAAFPPSVDKTGTLSEKLKAIAKLIAMQDVLGTPRQIFFVDLWGFDHHDHLMTAHPALLSELNAALSAFHSAMAEIKALDSVTLFTASDFGRTLTSNGDGSDHGWAGSHFVLGGAVKGGQIHGNYPVLEVGNQLDIGAGIFVPEYSTDQYVATLARWFGVPESTLPSICPNIDNFEVWDLGFLG